MGTDTFTLQEPARKGGLGVVSARQCRQASSELDRAPKKRRPRKSRLGAGEPSMGLVGVQVTFGINDRDAQRERPSNRVSLTPASGHFWVFSGSRAGALKCAFYSAIPAFSDVFSSFRKEQFLYYDSTALTN